MKTLASLVFPCVIAFAYCFFREQAIIKAQQERIEKLSEELATQNCEAKGGSSRTTREMCSVSKEGIPRCGVSKQTQRLLPKPLQPEIEQMLD
jgi:hypothetical protein